jgi:hypothetical protein
VRRPTGSSPVIRFRFRKETVLGGRALALLVVAAPSAARAQQAFPVEIVCAVGGEGKAGPVLVGRSGQIYQPGPDRVWRRSGGGGIAIDVRAAARSPSGELVAAGDQAPPFRFKGAAWHAEPVGNRGSATLSQGAPVPALAIGRHIYTLEKNAWQRRASAAKSVTALWAGTTTTFIAATSDGGLARWDGKRFTPVKTGLAAGDAIATLVGGSSKQVFGRSKAGRWIRVGGGALALAKELEGFDEHAAGIGGDGGLLLAGAVAGRPVLVRGEKNRLVAAGDLPALASGDRFAVVWAQGGELLVATRGGAVRVRGAAGSWAEGRVAGELPAVKRTPGAPARSR